MIKLLDRITNQQVSFQDLTGSIVPGRYLLLDDASINNHPKVQAAGTLLCGDGSGVIRIGDHIVPCLDQLKDMDEPRFQLASQAIHQIASFDNTAGKNLPSPLLPSQLLTDEGHLNDFEDQLKIVLGKGHLHEISRRPRMDMRYDELVQVVSRAKRLAPSSHRHLAAHSECWQRRTFTGIQPKRIMSLVSEDEYNLYENRAYARLLDRVERFLNRRLREIEALQQTINDALNLEGSEELNRRLSEALFSIWGETFTEDATWKAAELLEQTQATLEQQLKTIKGLMHSGIYTKIPRNAQVPSRLEPTNILTHDPHYRHIFPLWNTLTKVSRSFELTPEEKVAEQKQLQNDYAHYCGLLVFRALGKLGFEQYDSRNNSSNFKKGDHQISVNRRNDLWTIDDNTFSKSITLCPVATWYLEESFEGIKTADNIAIPCVLINDQQPDHPSHWLNGSHTGALQLSPMDFYVEERLISLFGSWLILNNVLSYGEEITKMPKDALRVAEDIAGIHIDAPTHTMQILQPLTEENKIKIANALKKSNARTPEQNFHVLNQALDELSGCPICGSKARFTPRGDKSFKSECLNNSCKLTVAIQKEEGERYLLLTTDDPEHNSFQGAGRWYQNSRLSQYL